MAEPTFEWDDAKDRSNQIKHGVSFEMAQRTFLDSRRLLVPDLDHSAGEQRYFCIGRVGDGVLTVRFTWRAQRIRIIGAGYWRKGRTIYDKENG